MWIVILLGLTVLRVIAAGEPLAASATVLEPMGVAVFLAGTGGSASPFLTLALAGIWWASGVASSQTARVYHIDRRSPELRLLLGAVIEAPPARRVWLIYGVSLVGAYLVLVLPEATRRWRGWRGHPRRRCHDRHIDPGRGTETSSALVARGNGDVQRLILDPTQSPIRDGLARALGTNEVPPDVVMAAGQAGLTVQQAELLPYLLLGLANQEIADAIQVSEATVRYRLTRPYRTLGVSGRRQAADRAREFGLMATPVLLKSTRSA
jgi:DNA-binding CsgD family transcriptional regulator